MIELVGERNYTTKVFKQNLGAPNKIGEFHIGHIHYIPPGETEFQDVDFTYTEYANRWELTKASYNLIIYKRFNGPRLIEWFNYFEGANHTIRFEPYALVWVDMTDPLNESSWQVIGNAQNVQGVEVGGDIVYSDAFGTDLDFIIRKRRHGMRKLVRINNLSALRTRPSSNHEVIALFKYTGPGLKVRANGASQDWDELSYYEGMNGFVISEIADNTKKSLIYRSTVFDSSGIVDRNRADFIKIFWAYRQNALWQAKVIPYDYLSNPELVYPVLADTISTFYPHDNGGEDGGANRWNADADWDTCRNGNGLGADDTGEIADVRNQYKTAGSEYRNGTAFIPFYMGLGSGVTINSAKLRIYGLDNLQNEDYGINVTEGDQASTGAVVASDYQRRKWTEFSTRKYQAGWTIGGWNEFDFITAGLTYIDNNKTGWAKLAVLGGADIDNNLFGSGNRYATFAFEYADHTGGHDPELVVDYGTGQDLVKVINETEQVSEGIVRLMAMTRIVNETENISEAIGKVLGFVRVINETENITEGIVRLSGLMRIINETEQISEGTLRPRVMARILNETVQITEGVIPARTMVRIINETENLTENITSLKSMVRVINETEQLTETNSKILGFVRIVNETVQISEGIVRLTGLIQVIDETLQVTEGTLRIRDLVRVVDESVSIQEGIIRARDLIRIINETEGIQENIVKSRALIRVINEALNVSEEILNFITSSVLFPILYQVEPRDRIFNVKARERMFKVEPRERTPDTGKRGN